MTRLEIIEQIRAAIAKGIEPEAARVQLDTGLSAELYGKTRITVADLLAALEEPGWPPELTPELTEILGRPNFTFIKLARLYRAAGADMPKKAEDEQAFFIHRMLTHWFALGDKWSDGMQIEIDAHVAKVKGQMDAAKMAQANG